MAEEEGGSEESCRLDETGFGQGSKDIGSHWTLSNEDFWLYSVLYLFWFEERDR